MARTKSSKTSKAAAAETAAPEIAPEAEAARPVAKKRASARRARNVAPLQKKLGKLRKQEMKRQRQLLAVQTKANRTSAELAVLLSSVTEWLKTPEAESAMPASKNGMREPAPAGH
jgi:hypothetical protein